MASSSLQGFGSTTDVQDWCITLSWDGRGFHGWQRQPQGPTIQQAVEEALSRVLGGAPVRVTASGRTDAGVHALAQVASFQTAVERSPTAIRRGLNANLPSQVACLGASLAPAGFYARTWSVRKLYRYRILDREVHCPHRRGQAWHRRRRLDLDAMSSAAEALVGTHDFSSFRASGCTAAHPVRCLESASIQRQGDEVHLEFIGNGFLRHQVRIMTGTLVHVGYGRWSPSELVGILHATDRTTAGPTAPPHGLWLVWVETGDRPVYEQSS